MHGTYFDADQTRFIIPLWILVRNTSLCQATITGTLRNKVQTGGNAGLNPSGSSIKHAKNQSSKADEFGQKTG